MTGPESKTLFTLWGSIYDDDEYEITVDLEEVGIRDDLLEGLTFPVTDMSRV